MAGYSPRLMAGLNAMRSAIFNDISGKCMKTLQSNEWTGYWQGNHRVAERLGLAA